MKQPTHIDDYLAQNARHHGAKPALVFEERSISWSELDQAVTRAARHIQARLQASSPQVVALLLPNSPDFVIAYLGIVRAGHIVLPLDPGYKQLEIDSIMRQIDPALSVTGASNAHMFKKPLVAADLHAQPPADHAPFVRLPATEQVVSMLFTSGTTGKPKATQYTHANHLWNIDAVSDLWEWTPRDTLLLSLPLSHWHGLVMGLTGALKHGNTIYLQERFYVEDTLKMLSSGKISLFMHVPIAYWKLIQVEDPARYNLEKVRLCVSGSSYLPPRVWHTFKRLFGHEILERYGSSETGLIASNPLHDRKPGSVGMLLPGVVARTQPDGELAMRSPGLFVGYYRNQAATQEKITPDNLWLTGDIGDFEADGRVRLKGRVIEKIKKLGYTVFPRDVEWALMQSPLIHDVVVVGVQDEDAISDTIIYFVVSPASRQEIAGFAKANLPAAWRPDKIIVLDEIPKTRSGKPERPKLLAYMEAAPA